MASIPPDSGSGDNDFNWWALPAIFGAQGSNTPTAGQSGSTSTVPPPKPPPPPPAAPCWGPSYEYGFHLKNPITGTDYGCIPIEHLLILLLCALILLIGLAGLVAPSASTTEKIATVAAI